jgi:hypothetical protein
MSIENLPSDKKFGLLFAAIFLVGAGYLFYRNHQLLAVLAGFVSCGLVVLAISWPYVLRPFNLLWFRFGNLLGLVVSPIVLGAIFFLLLTPVAVFLRLTGRDILGLKKTTQDTYWVNRNPTGPAPDSFKDQF